MKKMLQLALAGGALLSGWAAHAQESYVAVGVGQSEYSAGITEHKTAASLAFGQTLSPNYGYEVGYINFGKLSGAGEPGSFQSQAVYLSGVGTLPVNESLAAFGKLGVAAVYTKATGSFGDDDSRSQSETKAKLMASLGLSYKFSKEWAATLEYQYFGKVSDADVRLTAWTAGVKYGF